MTITLVALGLIFDFIGVVILVSVVLSGTWHQKNHTAKWSERYYWEDNILDFRKFPPRFRKVLKYGPIPPKHLWNSIGLLIIGAGFFLQFVGS